MKGQYALSRPFPILSVDCGNTIPGTTLPWEGQVKGVEGEGFACELRYGFFLPMACVVLIFNSSQHFIPKRQNICPICSNCTHSHKIHRLVMVFSTLFVPIFACTAFSRVNAPRGCNLAPAFI